MGSSDLDYGLEMLGKAVARDTFGIAATNDGGRERRQRIVRGLLALEKAALATVVRVKGRVFGAEFTAAGIDRGRAIGLPPFGGPGSKLVHRRSRDDGGVGDRR